MKPPRASLIISNWNGRQLLETCLPRVLRAVEQASGDHEVIVVDDASSDDSVEYVRREFPQVRLLPLKRNLRFAGANNAAARAATGEVLVFLNNDMHVEADFLGPLLQHFQDPDVFAATAFIKMPARRVGGGTIRETGLVRARFEDGFFVLKHEDPVSQQAARVLYAGGGSSAWRREWFLRLGAFDRLFRPFYFEDIDVSYRSQKAGLEILFEPTSEMVHRHRQTNSPRNFPGGYVELVFGRNALLFTWKVLTDPAMLREHFSALWRRLMEPSCDPRLGACFLRAAVQLPELLVKRHRARSAYVLSDREVIRRAAGTPSVEAADGGRLPYGSSGKGRRVLVVGFSPLPFERERMLQALGFRTWHVAQALLADGHDVTLVACRMKGAYKDEESRPSVLRFRGRRFTYYSVGQTTFERTDLLQRITDELDPEAMVAVHAYGAWAVSRLKTDVPLWADLGRCAMTEAQGRAALGGDYAPVAQAWEWERAALARADAFSVASGRQKYVLVGELFALGRLSGENYGRDMIHYMPDAVEGRPYRHREQVLRGKLVGDDSFVILWSGGYDEGVDTDTLFHGITAAMRELPRIRFVSTGGALPGRDEESFYRFRRRVDESEFADRFVFTGWVPTDVMPNYYFESDAGINVDRSGYGMQIGCRYRVLDMLKAGLPVIVTLGTETSHAIRQERLGLTFNPGDAEGLKEAVLALARDEALRRRCAQRAKDYVFKHRDVEEAMQPLRQWALKPTPAPDRLILGEGDTRAPWRPRTALGRSAEAWETAGAQQAAKGLVRAATRGLANLAARALVCRRGTDPWGLDPSEPPHKTLVIRAGSAGVTRELVEHIRARYPAAQIMVLAPDSLAAETSYETEATVVSAPGTGLAGYRLSASVVRALRAERFDTLVVAGEGNRRAELLALLAGAERRMEVRDDGAAHTFVFAPYKPVLLLASLVAGMLEKVTLSTLVGVVWGSITVEGWAWRLRRQAGAPVGDRR